MNKPANSPFDTGLSWPYLVEAALLETSPHNLSRRLEEAHDAMMDYIENSFETANLGERQSMINAINSLREIRRLVLSTGAQIEANTRTSTDA